MLFVLLKQASFSCYSIYTVYSTVCDVLCVLLCILLYVGSPQKRDSISQEVTLNKRNFNKYESLASQRQLPDSEGRDENSFLSVFSIQVCDVSEV